MSNEETIAAMAASDDEEEKAALMLQLYDNNAPLINRALKPFSYYAEMDDLRQEAFLALYKIVERFNPERAKFATALTNFLPGILRARMNEQAAIKVPAGILDRMGGVNKELRELEARLGHTPTEAEILDALELHRDVYREIKATEIMQHPASLDKPLNDEEEPETLADQQADPFDLEAAAIAKESAGELEADLWQAVEELPEANRAAVVGVYVYGQTLAEIAEADGVSREAIRRRRDTGLTTIRERHGAKLRSEWEESDIFAEALHGISLQTFRRNNTSSVERVALALCGED